jgi:hypothetical protein
VKPDIVVALGHDLEVTEKGRPKLPRMLEFQQQLARVMSRAVQMDRRVTEIEKYVKRRLDSAVAAGSDPLIPLTTAMSDAELARWQYCQDASARAELTAARLQRELREELEHLMQRAGPQDLVGAMALASAEEAEEAGEPEPTGESED